MLRLLKVVAVALSSVATTACVSDPKVEDYAPPSAGAHQPSGDGVATLSATEACTQLVSAETASRAKLACTASPSEQCPAHLAVAGALPCGLYDASTVAACVSEIGKYAACSDFDTKPCIVTAVVSSCHAPPRAEGGTDATVPTREGGSPDATTGKLDSGARPADATASDAPSD